MSSSWSWLRLVIKESSTAKARKRRCVALGSRSAAGAGKASQTGEGVVLWALGGWSTREAQATESIVKATARTLRWGHGWRLHAAEGPGRAMGRLLLGLRPGGCSVQRQDRLLKVWS